MYNLKQKNKKQNIYHSLYNYELIIRPTFVHKFINKIYQQLSYLHLSS